MTHHIKRMKWSGDWVLDHVFESTQGYAPCTKPLSQLKEIQSLRDLIMGSHHEGMVIFVRTFCEAVRIECHANAIEDKHGNVDRLAVFNVSAKIRSEVLLPRGVLFAIKEPFYRRANDGGVVVRVDHPTNIMILGPADEEVPDCWRVPRIQYSAAVRLDQADQQLVKGNWQECELLYCDAERIMLKDKSQFDEEMLRNLHRNRSQVRFHLRQYEIAADDALNAVVAGKISQLSNENKALNFTAYVRAARNCYEARDFGRAEKCFELALGCALTKEIKASLTEDISKNKTRLVEMRTGKYDFKAMAASATATNTSLDHASFIKNTKIALAGHRGRGLFTTKDIKYGDIILVEKAAFGLWNDTCPQPPTGPHHHSHSSAEHTAACEEQRQAAFLDLLQTERVERTYAVWKKLRGNPRLATNFLNLWDGGKGYHFHGQGATTMAANIDGQTVLDMFQLRTILDSVVNMCPEVKSSLRMVSSATHNCAETCHKTKPEEKKTREDKKADKKQEKKDKKAAKKNKGKEKEEPIPAAATAATAAPAASTAEAGPSKAGPSTAAANNTNKKTEMPPHPTKAAFGVWTQASYINHSCLPNAHKAYMGDMLILRATRNITLGEEIFVNYIDSTWHYDKREKALAGLGIAQCECQLCKVEAEMPPEVVEKRKKIERDIDRFMEDDKNLVYEVGLTRRRPACLVAQQKVYNLYDQLSMTYPEPLYGDLPRYECLALDLWLCENAWTVGEVVRSAQRLLRDMGLKNKWAHPRGANARNQHGPGEHTDTGLAFQRAANVYYGGSVVYDCVLGALLGAAAARDASAACECYKKACFKFGEFAKEVHLVLYGEELNLPKGHYDRPFSVEKN